VTITNDPQNTIVTTGPINIRETSLVVNSEDTNNTHPSFNFTIINPPNNFAEFTLEISSTEDFSSPTTLAFRITETDTHLMTLEGANRQDISYLDGTFPYGTIFWRVRRNQSDFSDVAQLTIRTAPVVQLQFTIDSQFVSEIGTVANVKILALDAVSVPVQGARV